MKKLEKKNVKNYTNILYFQKKILSSFLLQLHLFFCFTSLLIFSFYYFYFFYIGATLGCTLEMITKNMVDYPEHRIQFYLLLTSIITHTFQAFFQIPPASQKHVIDAIVWGFKHRERNIAQTGLDLLFTFLEHANNNAQFNQAYYAQFFLSNLNDVFYVLTDR